MNKLKQNYLKVPLLETQRLILDSPKILDYKKLKLFLKSDRSKYIGGPYNDLTSWYDYMANIGHWSLYGYGLWSIRKKKTKQFVGRVGIIKIPFFKEPDLAWQIFEEFEGKGYATEAAIKVKMYALKHTKISNFASHILKDNKKSLSLADKLNAKKKKIKIITNREFIVYYYS